MTKTKYRVSDVHAKSIAGQRVVAGVVELTAAEASWPLAQEQVVEIDDPPPAPVQVERDPLDHDGDGRRGGSLPKYRRGRGGR